ncbi:putative RNA-directed DNA polymerase [Helianthus annuus]|nr:putative RNA-directed DNA polymerase [Helianthus annuus]
MFPLNLSHDIVPRVCNVMTQDMHVLWHRRYGHINFDTLHKMGAHEVVTGLPKISKRTANICEGCLFGKNTRKSFPKHTTWHAEKPLQLIHSDTWSGRKPSVGHLKVFGCVAYAHVPKQNRGKLDDKVEKAIFIGYSESSKAYKLYNPITRKTIISRDVVFDEEQEWNERVTHKEVSCIDLNGLEEEASQLDVTEQNDSIESEASNQDEAILSDDEHDNTSNQHENEESSSSSSENEELRTRGIAEIYQNTQPLTDTQVEELYQGVQDVQNEMADFVLYADADPVTYSEAVQDKKWKDAMDKEMQSIHSNETWNLVDPPKKSKAYWCEMDL